MLSVKPEQQRHVRLFLIELPLDMVAGTSEKRCPSCGNHLRRWLIWTKREFVCDACGCLLTKKGDLLANVVVQGIVAGSLVGLSWLMNPGGWFGMSLTVTLWLFICYLSIRFVYLWLVDVVPIDKANQSG